MYVKLALRNVKRSAKDYLIYMLTLILSVGLFYGFLSITSPFYNSKLPIQMNLGYFSEKMKIIIPIIALLLIFLISYVNRYMIKRRKKEFALQTIMGMEQRTVAYLFFIEMLIMGLVAVCLGVVLGILLSQIVSVIIMNSFGEVFQPYFSVYPDTIAWTLLFFTTLFLIIGIGNVRVIRRQKIIDMLHDNQKTESASTLRNMLLSNLVAACVLDSCIMSLCSCKIIPFWNKLGEQAQFMTGACMVSAVIFLLCAFAFLFITGKMKKDGSLYAFMLSVIALITGILQLRLQGLIDEMLRSGLISGAFYTFIPPVLALGMIIFCLIALFGCLSWLLVMIKNKSKSFKYQNLFLLGQIISKLKTNSKMMAVLSCVFLCSLVLLGWLPTFTTQVDGYLKVRSVYDIQIFSAYTQVDHMNELPKTAIDDSYLNRYLTDGGYEVIGSTTTETYFLNDKDFGIRITKDMPVLGVSLSDYNALLRLSGHEEISLPSNGFAVAWYHKSLPSEIEEFNQLHSQIQAGKYTLSKVNGADYQVNVGMGIFTSRIRAVYILPDSICNSLTLATIYYAANTTKPLSYDFAVNMDKEVSTWINSSGMIPKDSGYVRLKTLQLNEGISNSLMFRLGGAYTSLVLIIICLTILALQQLTDASEHKHRFLIIEKIGVDKSQITKLIQRQMSIWFGVPIVVALCGAGAIFIYLLKVNYQDYIPYITVNHVLMNIISVYGVFFLIFSCYLTVTYILFKRDVVE